MLPSAHQISRLVEGMLCIGHSHMGCVLLAAQAKGSNLPAIILKDQVAGHFNGLAFDKAVLDDSERTLSPATERIVERASGPIFSFVGGPRLEIGLRRHPQPFDFVLPEQPDLPIDPEAELIPSAALATALKKKKDAYGYYNILDRIAAVAKGPVYQFEWPPPAADEWLVNRVSARQRSGRSGRELPVNRFLRYKLWRLTSQTLREHTAKLGFTFVPHPPAAADEEGFLRIEYVRNASHANPAYGALVLEQLKALQ